MMLTCQDCGKEMDIDLDEIEFEWIEDAPSPERAIAGIMGTCWDCLEAARV